MLYDSSYLKSESCEGSKPGVIHVINQLTPNDKNIFMFDESYVDTAYLIQVATYLYYEYLKLSGFALVKK